MEVRFEREACCLLPVLLATTLWVLLSKNKCFKTYLTQTPQPCPVELQRSNTKQVRRSVLPGASRLRGWLKVMCPAVWVHFTLAERENRIAIKLRHKWPRTPPRKRTRWGTCAAGFVASFVLSLLLLRLARKAVPQVPGSHPCGCGHQGRMLLSPVPCEGWDWLCRGEHIRPITVTHHWEPNRVMGTQGLAKPRSPARRRAPLIKEATGWSCPIYLQLLFTWNSDLAWHPVFFVAVLAPESHRTGQSSSWQSQQIWPSKIQISKDTG